MKGGADMSRLPKDPVILLSFLNTQLRDFYPSLEELCGAFGAERGEIEETVRTIGYAYDAEKNQFV